MDENQPIYQKHHSLKFILILAVVLGFIALGILSLLRERIVNPNEYQVSFTGEGRVFAKPDIAQIQVAVKTDRVKDAVKAVQQNTEKMNRVIDKIKGLGIEEKDIKTTSYRLTPAYDYNRDTGERTLAGYDVYQEVTVKIRDLNKVGQAIESTTQAGANQVGSISFTIDDLEIVKKEAREDAVAKAKAKAEEMSKLTGIKLGKLVDVYESEDAPIYRSYGLDVMAKSEGLGGAAPDIQVGENEVKLNVTLVYQVK